jgi:hypothetical protein
MISRTFFLKGTPVFFNKKALFENVPQDRAVS